MRLAYETMLTFLFVNSFWSLTDAVVTDAAVRRSWRSEDLTGVAVLEFDDLVVDLNVADSGWGALPSRDIPIGRLCGSKTHCLLELQRPCIMKGACITIYLLYILNQAVKNEQVMTKATNKRGINLHSWTLKLK